MWGAVNNLEYELPGLHPNIYGRIKNGKSGEVRSYRSNRKQRDMATKHILDIQLQTGNDKHSHHSKPSMTRTSEKRAILSDSLTYLTALNKVKRIDENEAAQNCLRRLEKLNKQKARGKKTNRMGIIGKSNSDIETMNKKKQQRGENR
jgi:hypothetical protein